MVRRNFARTALDMSVRLWKCHGQASIISSPPATSRALSKVPKGS